MKWYQVLGQQIKNHRLLFVLLILLQFIFPVSSFFAASFFQFKAIEQAQNLIAPLEDVTIAENLPSLTASYQGMQRNLRYAVLVPFLLFLLMNGLIWSWTYLFRDVKTSFWKRYGKFILFTVIIFLPYFVLADLVLMKTVATDLDVTSFLNRVVFILGLSIPLYYLFAVGLALLEEKKFYRLVLKIAVGSIQKILPVFVLNALLLAIPFVVFFLALEEPNHPFIAGLCLFVFLILTVVFRLFWINYVNMIKGDLK